ncbi:MAG: hypothetical protein E7066_06485 [Lentimicrobiaceae bacterium]|nr:hypothetical protein [Lentimicrobiaceae bacterium]
MKKISLLLGTALMVLMMSSCGPEKEVVTTPTSTQPCSDCRSTSDVFRYLGQHVASSDRQIQQARLMAANTARAELASQAEAVIERVVDNYTSEYITNADSDFKQRIQDLARTIVKQEVKGTMIICEGTMPGSTPGNTICYVCVELTGKSIMDALSEKISGDEQLRTDFEYEKFKKVLEEEMSKL